MGCGKSDMGSRVVGNGKWNVRYGKRDVGSGDGMRKVGCEK